MKVTNKSLLDSVAALNELNEVSLPVRGALKVAKISRKVDEALSDYNKALGIVQNQYVEHDENGEQVVKADPNDSGRGFLVFADRKAFDKAFKELVSTEVDVDLPKLVLSDLEGLNLKPSILFALDWVIDS